MSDNEKYNWYHASHDYGYGWRHGFQSRGIAPSFLGSDSLPQGLSDLHWAMHGIQHNMDIVDAKIGTLNDNIAKIANDMKEDITKGIEKSILSTNKNALSPLTDDTSTVSKVMTTRTRIFSDSFGPETNMPTNDRIRGLTKNYDWIQYSQKNPTCEGDYDKVIDFNFVSDHQEDDELDSRYVSKGKIILDKAGLIKRVYVTQHGANIVLWYLVTQSVLSETGVAYTGSVRRVEYDYKSNLVSEKWVNLNHTPLILLGAFSADVNDETEFLQYISTDYKLYQHKDGNDKELGVLPTDIVMLIDPLNDLVSDTKEVYIMKYDSDGKLLLPLEGFTLVDMVSGDKIINKFSKISLSNKTKLLNNIVSISPRTDTLLTKDHTDDVITSEGGYYVEVYDNKHKNLNVSHSHIMLLSSSKENRNIDSFAPTMMNFYSDKPSEFALKRERDYTEFNQITFKSGIRQMFPEIVSDFGIPEDTMFTLETDWNNQKERVTIWLKEPFILERNISDSDVNNRLGYTVVTNSDYVKDVADTDILSVYRKLDFVNKTPTTRNYLRTLPKYDDTYQLPKYLRYKVVDHSDVERGAGKIEVTYFDEINSVSATIDAPNKVIIGNIKYNENLTEVYNERTNKFSPSVNSQYLSDLIHSDVIYLEGKDFLDKPYGSKQYVLKNETTGSRVTQRLYTSTSGNADTNNDGNLFNNRTASPSTASNSITFNVPTNYETTSTTEENPMSFDFVIDGSSSFASKFRGAIDYVKYVIDNCITNPNSNIMVQLYTDNYPETYAGRGVNRISGLSGMSSVLLNKSSALALLDRIKNVPLVTDKDTTIHEYDKYFTELAKAFGSDGWTSSNNNPTPFEEIFDSQTNKHTDFSVLQITDGWIADREKIDTSFVEWAKKARTFMTVLNKNQIADTDTNSDQSVKEMTKAGHPNIYDMTGKNDSTVKEELVRKFKETAIVKQDRRVIPTRVTITRTDIPSGVTLTKSFTGGSLSDSSTMFSGDLQAGDYTLNVSANGIVDTAKTITFNVTSPSVNKSVTLTLNPSSGAGGNTLAKHYSNVPVEETVFTRTIVNGKVGEWFGSGYITELKYLNIPGSYNTGTLENGNYFQSANPSHEVFNNIVTRGIFVEGITNNMTHVVYRITNDIGLSMSYHNITIREDRTDNVGYTSKPYRLLYSKWIPGEYIGNDKYPLGPDMDSVTKYLLDKIGASKDLERRLNSIENALKSIVGSLRRSGAWDPSATPDTSTSLDGGVKSGVDIAYGNINLFGGTLDGNNYIRTNNGHTENDLAGILDA